MDGSATSAAAPAPFGATVAAFMAGGVLATGQLYVLIPLLDSLARAWHVSVATITLLPTVFAMAYGVGQAVWGAASDRYGRRVVLSAGLASTGALTMVLAAADSLHMALVIVVLQGFSASSFSAGALAHLAQRITPSRRALAISLVTSSFFAAAVVGQVLSQVILHLSGWRAVLLTSGGALLASAIWIARVVEAAPGGRPASRAAYSAMFMLLRDVRLMLAFVASVAILGSFVGVYSGLELMGPGALRHDDALLALRASGLPALMAVPLIVMWLSRVDPAQRASGALAVAAVALLATWTLGDNPFLIATALLVFAAAIGNSSPAIAQVIARESGDASGAALGLWGFFLFLGASGGPQLAALLRPAGFDALLLVLAGILMVAAMLAGASALVPIRDGSR